MHHSKEKSTNIRKKRRISERRPDSLFLLSDPIPFLKNDIRVRSASCFGWNHTIRTEQCVPRFHVKFLHLLSIGRWRFSLAYHSYRSVTRDFCSKEYVIIDKESNIELNVIFLGNFIKFWIESRSVQGDFNAKFLHLLSIARLTFCSGISCM